MTALARELEARGHEVIFIGIPDTEPIVRAAALPFAPICEREYPADATALWWDSLAKRRGLNVLEHTCHELMPHFLQVSLDHLPDAIARTGVEALVVDTTYFFVPLVAQRLKIPCVQVWNVLNLDPTGTTPPYPFSWPYDSSAAGLQRNGDGLQKMFQVTGPSMQVGIQYAERHGMNIDWNDPDAGNSTLAVISQLPEEFDFPGIPWPAHFHYAGPLVDDRGREEIPFPWERLDGRALIYASLGTVVNGSEDIYRKILAAVGPMPDVQLVLSIGTKVRIEDLGTIPSNVVVVSSAPQIELLKRSAVCITHAGLNTTLECLTYGVPMLAIPIGFDQPGVAARIRYHAVGDFIELEQLTAEHLAELIEMVRVEPYYREQAAYFQKVLAEKGGLKLAADIVEQSLIEHADTSLISSSVVGEFCPWEK